MNFQIDYRDLLTEFPFAKQVLNKIYVVVDFSSINYRL